MTSTIPKLAMASILLSVAACDYSGDFLFPGVTDVDDIWVMTGPDGDILEPTDIEAKCADLGITDVDGSGTIDCDDATAEEAQQVILDSVIYAEVGPARTTAYGGVTVDFEGTGEEICVWVDPELVFWSNAVADRPAEDAQKWTYPDNVFDDGDIDLFAGLSVYYTGSPGETIGDFKVAYEDSLGNEVPISLALCPNQPGLLDDFASGGRGAPDYCTLPPTDVGIGYTTLLRTWSTPLDDDRLSFGFLITRGSCDRLRDLANPGNTQVGDECVIQGEALTPDGAEAGPFFGFDEVNELGRIWDRSIELEGEYCDDVDGRIDRFCNREAEDHTEADTRCWTPGGPYDPLSSPNAENRCFCGDPKDTPSGGAI
jgi:hypothetical protein